MKKNITVEEKLSNIYCDMMWLAKRPHVTTRQARAWYSQVLSKTLSSKIRVFTGKVSKEAINNVNGKLVLEHYRRLSFELSGLLETHLNNEVYKPKEFLKLIKECERVNITTDNENHTAQANKGDYKAARIELLNWKDIDKKSQIIIWNKKLKGHVCNALDFKPLQ